METSRHAIREAYEITRQHKKRQENLLGEELSEDKLTHLLAFVSRLEQTLPGTAELERRTKLFGDCNRIKGETSGRYYGRLRQWLDRESPQKKSTRHAPRRTDD